MSEVFRFQPGHAPLIVSVPHAGLSIPEDIAASLTEVALDQPDADHAVDQLYDFATDLGASLMAANLSRYVVDLNRPPNDASLYPGQVGSGLVPTETFDGAPLYHSACPSAAEVARRVALYWRPYHAALSAEIARVRARFGYCLLWDAHSITPVEPRLFEGRLPDLNLGSFDGRAAPRALADVVLAAADGAYSRVVDGRFKGGYITRAYGDPQAFVFALQMELAQSTYLAEGARLPDPLLSGQLRSCLKTLLKTFLSEAPSYVRHT